MVATPSHCSYLMSDTNIGGFGDVWCSPCHQPCWRILHQHCPIHQTFHCNFPATAPSFAMADDAMIPGRGYELILNIQALSGKFIVDLSQDRSVNGNIDSYWENHSTFLGVSQHPPNWAGSMEQRFPAVWQSEGRSNESALVPTLISRRSNIERIKITQLLHILIDLPLQSCSVRGGKVTISPSYYVVCVQWRNPKGRWSESQGKPHGVHLNEVHGIFFIRNSTKKTAPSWNKENNKSGPPSHFLQTKTRVCRYMMIIMYVKTL